MGGWLSLVKYFNKVSEGVVRRPLHKGDKWADQYDFSMAFLVGTWAA
jgi:hypothetical protein